MFSPYPINLQLSKKTPVNLQHKMICPFKWNPTSSANTVPTPITTMITASY